MGSIPVIDLFAGPGGLGEGFSSLTKKSVRTFDIKLSIEQDENAHRTLEFRSFFRQFAVGKAPAEYYEVLRESDLKKREETKQNLYSSFPEEYNVAKHEAWCAELGNEKFPAELIDTRINDALCGIKNWMLIGGPPCQAFSLVGRSRVGGVHEQDHRVYLYKEYLRIIAQHHPAVFVMENVKGLLSAKVNGEKVFDWIIDDLKNPSKVFPTSKSPRYKIYSLSTPVEEFDLNGNPVYKRNQDFLIRSEQFGVPQKRHRVILLGIREDIDTIPTTLIKRKEEVKLKDIIGDLPVLRSGLNRSFLKYDINSKRVYEQSVDSNDNWDTVVNDFAKEIKTWNGFSKSKLTEVKAPKIGTGSEFIKGESISKSNPLFDWFHDSKVGGVCNHQSRSHLVQDLRRYLFSSIYSQQYGRFPRLPDFEKHSNQLLPDHKSAKSGKFADRFRVQLPGKAATTVTSHISKDGHYFIHYDPNQCRSLTVREGARIQTFPDNYLFCGPRTAQYHQVGNAVPPYLASQIAEIASGIFDLNTHNNQYP